MRAELRIKDILKKRGEKLGDLAIKLGMNKVSLSATLSNNPTLDTLNRIAEELDVPLRSLFYESGIDEEVRAHIESNTVLFVENLNSGNLDLANSYLKTVNRDFAKQYKFFSEKTS